MYCFREEKRLYRVSTDTADYSAQSEIRYASGPGRTQVFIYSVGARGVFLARAHENGCKTVGVYVYIILYYNGG